MAFRHTVPTDTTPKEISEVTGIKFGWNGKQTVTSERYVQGVVAGYDFARRELLDDLRKSLKLQPTSAVEWLDSQLRPPTPKQLFED